MKLGKAFFDSLIVERRTAARVGRDETRWWWLGMGRALIITTVGVVSFFILLWRLFDLTLVGGAAYRKLSDGNRTRELTRHAPRGLLLDRTGKPLVANVAQYRLLSPCTGTSIGKDCVAVLIKEEGEKRAKQGLPPGTFLEVDYQRRYLYPDLSHVLGYTGQLSTEELADEYYSLRNYRAGDRVGRIGAEAVFEDRLRGRDGKELVEIDASGKVLRSLGRQEEVPGEDITLSLDAGISQAVARAFPTEARGAVVVTKPGTGEVLALFSSPSFSSNAFSSGISQSDYDRLVNDPDRPMFNRAIGGVYPPGSTFKIVTAIAGLEEGAVKRDTLVEDSGVLTIGPFSFPNWYFLQYGKTEGMVDIVRAIQRSNDIFFYKVGEWLGITKLGNWARKMGLGKPLGIELSGEAAGLVPDPGWKAKTFATPADIEARNNEWYLGDTYHVAIGQGYLLVTPLQVNAWTNVVASGGKLCKPTIEKMQNEKLKMKNCEDLKIKKETIDLISEGMEKACEPGGTGWPLFEFKVQNAKSKGENEKISNPASSSTLFSLPFTRVPVACKTGTAEFGDPKNRTHAWFTAFAPLQLGSDLGNSESTLRPDTIRGEPEISVTVLVEGAGEGSNVAAPIAKKIFEEWFGR